MNENRAEEPQNTNEQSMVNNDFTKKIWKWERSDIIAVIALFFAIIAFVIGEIREKRNTYNAETEMMIQDANNEFSAVYKNDDYKLIYIKYKEIQSRKPKYNPGCKNFLDKVDTILSKGNEDKNTKLLLDYADSLKNDKDTMRLKNLRDIYNYKMKQNAKD